MFTTLLAFTLSADSAEAKAWMAANRAAVEDAFSSAGLKRLLTTPDTDKAAAANAAAAAVLMGTQQRPK